MADLFDLAYAAGIIDGEGYIGITTQERAGKMQTPAFQAVVNVGMVDLEVVAWLHQTFGGNLHSYPPGWGRMKRGVNHWRMTGRKARDFCEMVGPYMRLKRSQAAMLVRYYDDPALCHTRHGGRGCVVPEAEIARKREYAQSLRDMNQRLKKCA